MDAAHDIQNVFEEHGVLLRGEDVPVPLLFVMGDDSVRNHYIHVVKWKDKTWNDHIIFQDSLRDSSWIRSDGMTQGRTKGSINPYPME